MSYNIHQSTQHKLLTNQRIALCATKLVYLNIFAVWNHLNQMLNIKNIYNMFKKTNKKTTTLQPLVQILANKVIVKTALNSINKTDWMDPEVDKESTYECDVRAFKVR